MKRISKNGDGAAPAYVDFDAIEAAARERLPRDVQAFLACGADDEITAAENVAAWRRMRLRPKMLSRIESPCTETTILDSRIPTPIMVAPSGRHALFHPEAEAATARGAAAAGVPFVLSSSSNTALEAVAACAPAAIQWFQLYLTGDRAADEAVVSRAARAGFRALVLTVDQPVSGWSPRAAAAPLRGTGDRYANRPGAPLARSAYEQQDAVAMRFPVTLVDIERFAGTAPLPVVVKGVLRADVAADCARAGAKGVIVSNHGGRHLDTAVATAGVVAEVADAVGDRCEVLVDGGIRRGTDVVKALALGARAVLVGRPVLSALTLGGARGVAGLLESLRNEFARAMILCGATRIDGLSRDLVELVN